MTREEAKDLIDNLIEILEKTLDEVEYYRELARTYAKTINKLTKIIEQTQERTDKQ